MYYLEKGFLTYLKLNIHSFLQIEVLTDTKDYFSQKSHLGTNSEFLPQALKNLM